VLKLRGNSLTDEGVKALAQSPILANVLALNLSDNAIGDAGAQALAESPYLQNLLYLSIDHTNIEAPGLAALRERFGERVRPFGGDPLPSNL
jgi:hypothetical protein